MVSERWQKLVVVHVLSLRQERGLAEARDCLRLIQEQNQTVGKVVLPR